MISDAQTTGQREFADKRVLITGGTHGIGAAMVCQFAASGALVATMARHKPVKTSSKLFIEADIAQEQGVQLVISTIVKEWGGIDILINNFGPGLNNLASENWFDLDFTDLSDEHWQKVMDWNLLSAVRFDRALIPGMIERGKGVVLHVGSISHQMALPACFLPSAVSKAALANYSKGLAMLVGRQGVRVNMISPGYIYPGGSSLYVDALAQSKNISTEEAVQDLALQIGASISRPGTPDEVAGLAMFLASERAAFVHGVDYTIDGGRTLPR